MKTILFGFSKVVTISLVPGDYFSITSNTFMFFFKENFCLSERKAESCLAKLASNAHIVIKLLAG